MSQQTGSKVPKIRFNTCEGPWEVLPLSRAASFRRGSFPQPYGLKKWYNGPGAMPFIQVVDVAKNLNLVEKTKQQISRAAQPKSVFVEQGSVVVTLQGSIGRVAVSQYDAYADRTLLIFTEYTNQTNTFFWAYLIQGKFDVEKERAPGGTIKTITKEALSAFQVALPNFKEQTQIGSYFKSLDRMIGLHQRKHDKLVTLKQAMLQKMFPQDGATTPEIRFKGFEGDWQQKTLQQIVEVCSGRDYKHLTSGDIPVYGTGGYMLSVNEALSPDKDAIGIGRKGTIDKPYLLRCPFWTVDTLFYAVPLKEYDLDFVFCIFQIVDWKKFDESTGVPSLSKLAINQILQLKPSFKEQQRIGAYFRILDELISKHATQLEKLKNVKAACLEKMFV